MVVATGAAGTDLKDTLGSLTKSIQKQNAMAEEQKKKSAAQARKKLEVADEKAKQALDKLKNQIANSSGEQKTTIINFGCTPYAFRWIAPQPYIS